MGVGSGRGRLTCFLPHSPFPTPLSTQSFGRTFQNHDRQVVDGAGSAYEFRERLIDAVADARGGAAAVLLNDFDQARLAEFFALFVQALGDAVGIDDHDVARLDFDPAFAVIAELREASREAGDA